MNKSKYQEAINDIDGVKMFIKVALVECEFIEDLYNEELDTLRKLLDKATPKKAVWIEDFLRCPSCLNYDSLSDGYGEHHNYCNECGQALDWSEDE